MLIGFMATGKTTVGRIVAERLQRPFVDLDRRIEALAGRPVAEVFRAEGEPAFRRLESEALRAALREPEAVIATGGGAACREENLAVMLDQATVVALSVTPAEVIRRTGTRSGRPLLDGAADPLTAAKELLEQREPFYARAHAQVDTVGRTPEDVAAEVISALGRVQATRAQQEPQ